MYLLCNFITIKLPDKNHQLYFFVIHQQIMALFVRFRVEDIMTSAFPTGTLGFPLQTRKILLKIHTRVPVHNVQKGYHSAHHVLLENQQN